MPYLNIPPKLFTFTLTIILAAKIVAAAEPDSHYVQKTNLPDGPEIIVVAEGEFEARSVGSYTLRIYSRANPSFPLDDYVAGLLRPRNGSIEEVRFHDFDGDGRAEIMIVIRSAGSGGYLSADVFAYREKSLRLVASVSDLPKDADLVAKIKQTINGKQREPQ